jgi:DNA polymerase-3 subunit epsilon
VSHVPSLSRRPHSPSFTAIDFETANRFPNSACAIGLVRVERGRIVRRAYHLVRPPFRTFEFTHIHHIDWPQVRSAPTFAELWPTVAPFFAGIDFVAAHNAPFDAGVLRETCAWYGLASPTVEFRCTVRLARATWDLYPTKLSDVARFLGLELDHHHAGSDAEACARIVLKHHCANPRTARRRRKPCCGCSSIMIIRARRPLAAGQIFDPQPYRLSRTKFQSRESSLRERVGPGRMQVGVTRDRTPYSAALDGRAVHADCSSSSRRGGRWTLGTSHAVREFSSARKFSRRRRQLITTAIDDGPRIGSNENLKAGTSRGRTGS